MNRFGPTRGELKLRLAISLGGLALMGVALALHGVTGLVWFEIVIFCTLFFGGSALFSLRALWKGTRQ